MDVGGADVVEGTGTGEGAPCEALVSRAGAQAEKTRTRIRISSGVNFGFIMEIDDGGFHILSAGTPVI